MRKISQAERRAIVEEYRNSIKCVGALAQQFNLEKWQISNILNKGGVVRPMGRPLVLPFSNVSADGRGMIIYKRAAREHRAVTRLDEMLTELRAAQNESGRTYLAGLIARDQRSLLGRVRPQPEPGAVPGELREG